MKKISKYIYRNLPNLLTGVRALAAFLYCYQVDGIFHHNREIQEYVLCSIVLGVICLSDFLDGRTARRFQLTSEFGAVFDLVTDILYVFLIHIQLVYYHLLPVWYLAFFVEKIVNYIVTSHEICIRSGDRFAFIKDPMGKMVSASYFVTPFFMVVSYQLGGTCHTVVCICVGILTVLGLCSSLYRLVKAFVLPIQKIIEE